MTLAEKLRFLADRAEDGKEFLIDNVVHVFDKNTLDVEFLVGSIEINGIKFTDLKLKPQWKFTEDEKVILRNIDEKYQWIARDSDNNIYIYIFINLQNLYNLGMNLWDVFWDV